eukprot:TRINITY_DN86743_c0_g1_i2.p1 TRINITY_DN86743_c0_g1~~TRINITY_DN86743_c0_g1_i2.p1  ORF type:complete len:371 (+),score=26.07 TRINITY_DN86743_c0_g1_i2:62-1114(+)
MITSPTSLVVPICLAMDHISYSIRLPRSQTKQLLNDVSATFSSGEFVAIMGSSGAGKTTLLRVLAGDVGGLIEGTLTLNGQMDDCSQHLRCHSQFVYQEDTLLASQTPYLTLLFQADLKLPQCMNRSEKIERVNRLLEQLNLEDCRDVPVGHVECKGLSGGQRKRLSLALGLISNPSILLMDEPTSGLDSKNAEDVIELGKQLSSEDRRSVVCSLHQPSWRILSRFDKVILLEQGSIIFYGSVPEMEEYFSSINIVPPIHVNPIDHIMREIQRRANQLVSDGKAMLNLSRSLRTMMRHLTKCSTAQQKSFKKNNPLPARLTKSKFSSIVTSVTVCATNGNFSDTVQASSR